MGLRFGIVGLGMIADFHAKALRAIPGGGAELVACCDSFGQKAKEFSQRHGCAGYTSLADFLSHPGLQAVTVCTPSGAHLDVALAAAAAGKHLLVEKPLEITTERCERAIEAARRGGVVLAGIFPSRFLEGASLIRDALARGRFGRLALGSAYVKWYRTQDYYDKGGWHGTRALDGGGALMNQSIHAVDLLQWLMGPVESVQAFTATLGHERIEVEDDAVAAVRFASGALGVIEGTTCAYPGWLKKIEICGTRGSVVLEEESLTSWEFAEPLPSDAEVRRAHRTTATGGGAGDPAAIGFLGHQKQFEDFIRAVETGGKPLVDGVEAAKSVRIIESIYESARDSRPVKLG